LEAEAIGVEAEVVHEIAASTSPLCSLINYLDHYIAYDDATALQCSTSLETSKVFVF